MFPDQGALALMASVFVHGQEADCGLCGFPCASPRVAYGDGYAHPGCVAWRVANESKEPKRGELPPNVVAAVRTIHRAVWKTPYTPGEGPMHYAGGPYWHDELLRLADRWERMAKAARVAATVLPERDRFEGR